MKPTARYRRRSDSITADLGQGQLAIMGMARGGYYALNPVGSVIWDFLDSPRSRHDIRAHVLDQFEVDGPTCERDVNAFLQDILHEGLAETVGE